MKKGRQDRIAETLTKQGSGKAMNQITQSRDCQLIMIFFVDK